MPYVNGVYMPIPGAAVTINDQDFRGSVGGTGLGILFIGPCTDGQPNTELQLSSPGNAIATLKGGDGLQAVLNAMKSTGISKVSVIRPEIATQATSAINSAGVVAQIALITTSYGVLANSAKWTVQAATTQGYKVSQGTDFVGPGGQTYVTSTQDNINLPVLSIACTGTTPTVTITDTSFVVTANATQVANITLNSTTTVQQLVNQLNQVATITATVQDPNPGDVTGALFDNLTTFTISGTPATPTTLYANITAVVRWFNALNLYFTATRDAGATTLNTANTWTYATGGTTPAAANSDWTNAYTTAQGTTGIDLISCVSPSYAIWAMNDAHCQYMATQGSPRRGYVGDALSATLSTEITQASILNSNRTSIVWPEQKGTDYNGNATTFASYLVAAGIMGQRAVAPNENSLVLDQVSSTGMGQTVTPPMVQQGLAGGVIVLYPNTSGKVVISQDRTTWLQNTAYEKVENSTGIVSDIVAQDLNKTLLNYVSQPISVSVGGATTAILARLNHWWDKGMLAAQPQSGDVSMTGVGTAISGTAKAAFVTPTNYAELTINAVSATITA